MRNLIHSVIWPGANISMSDKVKLRKINDCNGSQRFPQDDKLPAGNCKKKCG
jgi:hypothetical protein